MPFDYSSILLFVAIGAVFYFMLIRPQQKRAKEQQEMNSTLAPGARVMTSAGILATVKHVGERQLILEIAPGVEMTVVKQAVLKTLKADDDEFEYADDDQPADHEPLQSTDPVPDTVADDVSPAAAAAAERDAVAAPEEFIDDEATGRDQAKN